MIRKALLYIGPILAVLLFSAALWVLHHELKTYRYDDIVAAFRALPVDRTIYAAALTLLSYAAMAGYDVLAVRYIRNPLAFGRIVFASVVSYALSNNIGISILSASAARYRIYSAWGVTAAEVTKILAFIIVTFWLGFFTVCGAVLVPGGLSVPPALHLPFQSLRPLGVIFIIFVCAYAAGCAVRKMPLKIRGLEFSLPSLRLALSQISISSIDWIFAASVLYMLLPSGVLSFPAYLAVYMIAQLAGLISHVPGGLGVFESVIMLFLSPLLPASSVMASLAAYRAVYYLLPLAGGIAMLGVHETILARKKVKKAAEALTRWVSFVVPHIFALTTFLGGALLLFSGATPAVRGRLEFLREILPLPVLELSHLLGSLAGAAMVLLARGIQKRLDAAYFMTLVLLASGAVFSLLKGLDYEEAAILAFMFGLMLPSRRYFYRKASLFRESFTPGWIGAIILIIGASVWIGFFSYKHVEYSGELWWRFAFFADAPRFLRATVAVLSLAVIVAIAKLLSPASVDISLPDSAGMERALGIIRKSTDTSAYLALLRDKSLIFSDSGNAFIMYGVEGRSAVAMGDPVGEKDETIDLIWRFHEKCERSGNWTVFYEIGDERLPFYIDVGLSVIKIGEEGRTPLGSFSLEGGERKEMRHILHKMEREGITFDIILPERIPSVLPEMRAVSDAWLREKNTREKGFSLGFYDEYYLRQCPAALVRAQGRTVAFANIWTGAQKEELSIDLMRYLPDAPRSVMDYLFIQLMLWGRQEGYQWFNLGMAPFSGFEDRSFAPLWQKLGAFIFRHGEHFYNFQGIRQYKEKFGPQWNAKYIASPGGVALPMILVNIASLVSRGLKGVLAK